MRKIASWVLLALGAFLLVSAFLALVYAPNAAKRTPLSTDSFTYLTGNADKLNPATGDVDNVPVKVLSRTKVDDEKSDGDVIVFLNTTCANVNEGDPADCLEDDDDRLISNSIDIFATDRRTAEAVNDPAYLPDNAELHEGLINKFPFDVEKKTYEFFDGLLGEAVPVEYVGVKDIDGLETYEFNLKVDQQPAVIISDIEGIYSMDKTMFIEPTTGAIIDQEQHEVRTLEDGSTVLDMSLSFTDDTVAANVSDAKSNSRTLKALTGMLPWLAGLLGLIALAAGGFLLTRSSGSDS